MGLHVFAERIADLVDEIARSKKNAHEKRRKIIAGTKEVLREAVIEVGFDLAIITVRGNDAATLKLAEARKKLKGIVSSDPPP